MKRIREDLNRYCSLEAEQEKLKQQPTQESIAKVTSWEKDIVHAAIEQYIRRS